jgi:hypothetical protein
MRIVFDSAIVYHGAESLVGLVAEYLLRKFGKHLMMFRAQNPGAFQGEMERIVSKIGIELPAPFGRERLMALSEGMEVLAADRDVDVDVRDIAGDQDVVDLGFLTRVQLGQLERLEPYRNRSGWST